MSFILPPIPAPEDGTASDKPAVVAGHKSPRVRDGKCGDRVSDGGNHSAVASGLAVDQWEGNELPDRLAA
jgi:hypothetical protein